MEKRGAHHFLTNYTLAVGSHRSLRKLIPTARGYIAFVIGGGIAHCFPSPRGSTKPCKSLRLSTFLVQGNPPRRSEATKAAMHGSATGSLRRHSSGGFLIGAVAGDAARGRLTSHPASSTQCPGVWYGAPRTGEYHHPAGAVSRERCSPSSDHDVASDSYLSPRPSYLAIPFSARHTGKQKGVLDS